MKKIVIVTVEDWVGMYIDGFLDSENHSISISQLPKDEPIIIQSFSYIDRKDLEENVQERGGFPVDLETLKSFIILSERN